MSSSIKRILKNIYPDESIFLKRVKEYSAEERSITGIITVPHQNSTRFVPMPYVMAEEYLLAISQLAYVFFGTLAMDGISEFGAKDIDEYQQGQIGLKMWYIKTELNYLQKRKKGEDFEITLMITDVRPWKKYTLFEIRVTGSINGTLEYIAPF